MKIKLYNPQAIHELGQRDNQEDFIYPFLNKATPEDCLYIVCDGMGGHEHGEVASSTFASAIAKFFEGRVSPDIVLPDTTIADAIDYAYAELDKADDGNFRKMGTTLTMLYFHRGGVTATHIGDSRIYHIRPGKGLLYVSRDHSLVFDLYQSGELTYEEMKNSSQKNVITRAVQPGEENRVKPDIIHITDVQPGDYFYMCSDGMLEQMEDEELTQLLSAKGSNEKKRQQLIAATSNNKDNHSAYLIQVESVTAEADDALLGENEEKTSRCNALNIRPVPQATLNQDVELLPPDFHPKDSLETTATKKPFNKLLPLLFLLAALAIGLWVLFSGKHDKDPEPTDSLIIESAEGIKPIARPTHSQPAIQDVGETQKVAEPVEKPKTTQRDTVSKPNRKDEITRVIKASRNKSDNMNQSVSESNKTEQNNETNQGQP